MRYAIAFILLAACARAADIVTYSTVAPTAAYPSMVPKTWQTNSYATGDDGDIKKGVAWPNPRFTIQANTNAVLDNLTGLVWSRNANMAANTVWSDSVGTSTWANAFSVCTNANGLAYGGRKDWRVPCFNELMSVTSIAFEAPIVPNTEGTSKCTSGNPFFDLRTANYWTSSSRYSSGGTATARAYVGMNIFTAGFTTQTTAYNIWLCAGPD